jgi:hypothetical protein
MPRKIEMTGKRYGRLVVLGEHGKVHGSIITWACLCDCGNSKVIRGDKLRNGETRSCGCFARESASERFTKHGGRKTKLYGIWSGMVNRVTNPNNDRYDSYGGRGIKVCDRWMDFGNFRNDMGDTYRPGLTIERIDNDGNYEPGNCRWATWQEQARNKRTSHIIAREGEGIALAEAVEGTGIKYSTVEARINAYGWSTERALTEEVRKARIIEFRGYSANGSKWATLLGVSSEMLRYRFARKGWSSERTITEGLSPDRISSAMATLQTEWKQLGFTRTLTQD